MMKRALYYLFKTIAILSRIFRSRSFYMLLLKMAHSFNGVNFVGNPRFIHPSAVLDPTDKLVLGENIVISTGVLVLTHDYSYTTGLIALNERPKTDIAVIKQVLIGNDCFIGANSIILPGTKIGSNVIVGAGSVVKGIIDDFSIIAGNPAKSINDIRSWTEKMKLTIDHTNLLIDKK